MTFGKKATVVWPAGLQQSTDDFTLGDGQLEADTSASPRQRMPVSKQKRRVEKLGVVRTRDPALLRGDSPRREQAVWEAKTGFKAHTLKHT